MNHQIFIIMYDISDNRKRQKVADLLERYGYERLQLSIFTGLQAPYDNKELWKKLEKFIDIEHFAGDKIYCFAVNKSNFEEMKTLGAVNIDIDYLLGRKRVIIIS
ncbi:MAG: CRISPR-associated endonuclease Cas2 [Chitinophagaceae bacterium]|nr:CRISPR-associated endonuclease Cas2 [Chitinophagaceae bacterium]